MSTDLRNNWRPNLAFRRDLAAVQFSDQESFRSGLELLLSDDFGHVPFEAVGRKTVLVPNEAVQIFRTAGLAFEVQEAVPSDQAAPDEVAEMRGECGLVM